MKIRKLNWFQEKVYMLRPQISAKPANGRKESTCSVSPSQTVKYRLYLHANAVKSSLYAVGRVGKWS